MLRGIVGAALVCVLAQAAYADNKEAAKEAYSEGKRQYDVGDYQAALTAFKKAYLNYEEPVFLFNIAQCYRAIGDRAAAVRTYRAFLRNWPKAPNRAQVERIIAQLDAALAQDASAQAAPPQDTLPPEKSGDAVKSLPAAGQAAAEPKPAPSVPSTAPPTTRPTAPSSSPSSSSSSATAAAPAHNPGPPPATKEAAPKDELAGMVEVEPNFERPSGSSKPAKWWVWTLVAVGFGGLAAVAIAVAVTQTAPRFDTTLPPINVNNGALHALTVRF